jgi:hypothetical protein
MQYSKDKRIASMVRSLVAEGWRYLPGRKHGKLVAPNGRRLSIPSTPSDWRAGHNFVSDARRISRTLSS